MFNCVIQNHTRYGKTRLKMHFYDFKSITVYNIKSDAFITIEISSVQSFVQPSKVCPLFIVIKL